MSAPAPGSPMLPPRAARTLGRLILPVGRQVRLGFLGVMLMALSGGAPSRPQPAEVSAQFVPRQAIVGGYWSLTPGFESTLMLSNTSPEPIRVFPEVFDASGERIELPLIALREQQRQQIDLREWLVEQGVSFTSGSLRLRHTGSFYALAAQVTVTEMTQSWSFDFPVEPPGLFYHSQTLDGLWWQVEPGSQARLILTNSGERPLMVHLTLRLRGESHRVPARRLEPHQMQEIPVEDLLQELNLRSTPPAEGGLRLAHDGEPGDLVAYVLVWNRRGFSSTMKLVDPAARESGTLHGAGLFLKQNRPPGVNRLAQFDTLLLVGNTTEAEVEAQVRVSYTVGARTQEAALPSLRLAPHEVRRLAVNEGLSRAARLPRTIDGAGLEIRHTGGPAAVVAHAVSFDRSGDMAFDVLLKDPDALPTNSFSFPWRLQGRTRSLVQITNPRLEVGQVWLKLQHEAGQWEWGIREIEPGETVTLDIRELRDRLVESPFGEVIPPWVEQGQAEWIDLSPAGGLLGRVAIYEPQIKINTSANEVKEPNTPRCINFVTGPCSAEGVQEQQTAPAIEGEVGDVLPVTVYQKLYGCCSETFQSDVNISDQLDLLSSSDPAVAQVEYDVFGKPRLRLLAAGTATLTARKTTTVAVDCGELDGVCEVGLQQTYELTATRKVTVTEATGTVQITGTTVTPATVAPGGSATLTVAVGHSDGLSGKTVTVLIERTDASGSCVLTGHTPAQRSRVIESTSSGTLNFEFTIEVDAGSCAGTASYRATIQTDPAFTILTPAAGADQTTLTVEQPAPTVQITSAQFLPPVIRQTETSELQVTVAHETGLDGQPVTVRIQHINPIVNNCLYPNPASAEHSLIITGSDSGQLLFRFPVTLNLDEQATELHGEFEYEITLGDSSGQSNQAQQAEGFRSKLDGLAVKIDRTVWLPSEQSQITAQQGDGLDLKVEVSYSGAGLDPSEPLEEITVAIDPNSLNCVDLINAAQTQTMAVLTGTAGEPGSHAGKVSFTFPGIGVGDASGCEDLTAVVESRVVFPVGNTVLPGVQTRASVTVSQTPQVTITSFDAVCKDQTREVLVTVTNVSESDPVVLRLKTLSGQGEAGIQVGTEVIPRLGVTGTGSVLIHIKGITTSSTADNIRLEAVLQSQENNPDPGLLAEERFTVVQMTLEQEGQTVIEPANNYSENTTLKVTVTPSNITGLRARFMESETNIYDGQNGATDLTKDAQRIVQVTNGVARLTVKSVSNETKFAGPGDAFIFADLIESTDQIVCRSSNIVEVDQWVDADGDMQIDWLMRQAQDLLDCFKKKPGEVGQVANAVTGIREMREGETAPFGTTCGFSEVKDVQAGDENVIAISPVCVIDNVNVHRLNTTRKLSGSVIHEARHAWQNTLTLRTDLGAIDDDSDPNTPPNDDDRDLIPEKVPARSEAEGIFQDVPPTAFGDGTPDPRELMLGMRETDATLFEDKHKRKCP